MNQRILYATPDGGVAIIIPTGELPTEVVARKDVLQGVPYKIVDLADVESVISDRTFRSAWEAGNDNEPSVKINLNKAKDIAHKKRRAVREIEFKPFDEIIAKQIPGKNAAEAEAARQAVRNYHATLQTQIDAAQTVAELKAKVVEVEQRVPKQEKR